MTWRRRWMAVTLYAVAVVILVMAVVWGLAGWLW